MGRVRRQIQLLRLLLDISISAAVAVTIIVMIIQNRIVGGEPSYSY
jgi:hypothetical protein